jgi:ADP-heptose:LPS heptosyltransferase
MFDKTIGKTQMKNRVILWLTRMLQKFVARNGKTGNILVVTTTALGDTLWATPAIESLRASFPKAHITVLTSPIGEQVLRHNPWTSKVHVLREPMLPKMLTFWKLLRKERFETVIVLHASQRLMLPLCALLGAERIVGTAGRNKGLDQLLTDALAQKKQHEIVRRLELVERIGAKRVSETLSLFLEEEKTLKGPWIILHPGARDLFRRWPASHFAELGKKLRGLGLNVLVTGTLAEQPLVQEIASQIPGAVVSDPNLSFRSFAALLAQSSLVVTNDTGPLHIACALEKTAIGLFACTDPALFGPHKAKNVHVIAKRPTCEPCLKRACRKPFCQLQISPEEVFVFAKQLLKKPDGSMLSDHD